MIRAIAVCIAACLYPGFSQAAPLIFDLEAFGRFQSGLVQIAASEVQLTYSIDASAPDREASSEVGLYEGLYATLRIGSETAAASAGVGIAIGFFPALHTFNVLVQFSRGTAIFQGRELIFATFVFVDLSPDMLVSDELPIDPSFVGRASSMTSTFLFVPAPGDPNYGSDATTNFALCRTEPLDACVYAPLTLTLTAANAIGAPSTVLLLLLPITYCLTRLRPPRRLAIKDRSRVAAI